MLLKADCLPNAVGKQPSIPLIYLGRKWTLNWWWWWWWMVLSRLYYCNRLLSSARFVRGLGSHSPSGASQPPSLYWPQKIVKKSQKYIAASLWFSHKSVLLLGVLRSIFSVSCPVSWGPPHVWSWYYLGWATWLIWSPGDCIGSFSNSVCLPPGP